MKNLLLTFLLIPLSFANIGYASSSISLLGGPIPPQGQLVMPLSGLVDNVSYSVNCTITDANNANNKVILDLSLGTPRPNGVVSLEFSLADGGVYYHQIELPQVENQLKINLVKKNDTSVIIKNLDNSDSVSFSGCVATPRIS